MNKNIYKDIRVIKSGFCFFVFFLICLPQSVIDTFSSHAQKAHWRLNGVTETSVVSFTTKSFKHMKPNEYISAWIPNPTIPGQINKYINELMKAG